MNKVCDLPGRIYRKVLRYFPDPVDYSLGELMLLRKEVSHAQFSISALLMDVENYCEKGDTSFYYQNVGHKVRCGNDSDTTASNGKV